MAESSDDSNQSQMRWQFIDASQDSASNLTQVKRHVMQEYMRQKREAQTRDDTREDDAGSQKPVPQKRQRQRRTQAQTPTQTRSRAQSAAGKRRAKAETKAGEVATAYRKAQEEDPDDEVEEIERGPPPFSLGIRKSNLGYAHFHSLPLHLRHLPYGFVSEGAIASPSSHADIYSQEDQSDDDIRKISLSTYSGFRGRGSDLGYLSPWSRAASPLEVSPAPQTVLSAARTDPFDTLPLLLSPEDKRLFDFYVNEMPACSYGNHVRSKNAHNWYTEVFVPEGMKGAVTFVNTILVHAANTWAWVQNETETENTLVYRYRAISSLNKHLLSNPGDVSDVAITACLSAAALEDFDPRPGHKKTSWSHMRAARQMIRDRGGPADFENTKLAMLINWQDYILAGYETHGPSFYFEHNPPFSQLAVELFPSIFPQSRTNSLPSPPSSDWSVSPGRTPSPCRGAGTAREPFPLTEKEEIQLQCEELIDFLNRCEQLALSQKTSLPNALAPSRHSSFRDSSILHRILAAPPGKRFTATGNRKQFIARLAALMMLNAGLWDHRLSIPRTEAFLSSLILRVWDSEVDVNGSLEALLQLLLACKDGFHDDLQGTIPDAALLHPSSHKNRDMPDYSQYSQTATSASARPWFVGRMLKIAKRLSLESWVRLNDLFFSFLTLQVEEPIVPSWENELRREILQAPLTSYVMRALK